jgi:hypothetical protein
MMVEMKEAIPQESLASTLDSVEGSSCGSLVVVEPTIGTL